ncbi:restriction endonuclease subunit S [Streptomyces sp. NPDC087440]|uniref:restriction endonuclease subunit S n=1 Tax=Streptomyces sp. NPDC087440 TaxID=3365790 RepID=UPI00381334D7
MNPTVAVKRVAQIQYGLGQPPKLSEDGIPILRATNITRGKITERGLLRANLEDLPIKRAPLLTEGEILVVRSGAYTGDSARITKKWAGSAPGYDLRVTPISVESRYLAHVLLSIPVQDQIKLVSSRAAQPHLNAEDLGEVEIWSPPLEEQRRIADFLDAETSRIDTLISLQKEVLARLDERDRSLRDGLLDRLSLETQELPLRRFVTRIDQGASPQCDAVSRIGDEWGVLKLSAVKHGLFVPTENKRLPEDISPRKEYEVRDGDFLVTRANTPSLVGDVAVVRGNVTKLMLPDLIYRVGLTAGIDPRFVSEIAQGSRVRLLIEAVARGSSQSMVKLRGDDIREWPIPAANQAQQASLIAEIDRGTGFTKTLRTAIHRQLDLLAERRQSLITAAVTGQFDVSSASGRGVATP